MTTPERLRRRQRRETALIVLLGFGLAGSSIYFNAQDAEGDREDDAQRECLSAFIQNQTDTSAARSAAVEAESEATRDIIQGVFTATNGKQVQLAYDKYVIALKAIDKARDENPVEPFPEDLCGL